MSLESLTSQLYKSYDSSNYDVCNKLLPSIKIELIKHGLLIPLVNSSTTTQKLNDLRITKRILEIGALSSLLSNNHSSFENYILQLKPFYFNEQITNHNNTSDNNDETTKLISLYLLYLLSQGSISKFHLELETIYNSENLKIDEFLKFPINLEKNLMEGNYIKIWKLFNNPSEFPCQEFNYFAQTLIIALRFEISKSIEKTYTKLPINNLKNLLYYSSVSDKAEFESFVSEQQNWSIKDNVVYFKVEGDELSESNNELLIKNVLGYASEIETIV